MVASPFVVFVEGGGLEKQPRIHICANPLLPKAQTSFPTVKLPLKPGEQVPMTAACGDCKPPSEGHEGSGGQERSTLESLARELVYLAAMGSGQFNEETAQNGDPFGILGGKNIGGSSNPYMQIAAAVGILLANAAPSPAQLRKAFLATLAKGERVVWTTTSEAMEKMAEQLAKRFGNHTVAPSHHGVRRPPRQ